MNKRNKLARSIGPFSVPNNYFLFAAAEKQFCFPTETNSTSKDFHSSVQYKVKNELELRRALNWYSVSAKYDFTI